jgi:hypothetical protein
MVLLATFQFCMRALAISTCPCPCPARDPAIPPLSTACSCEIGSWLSWFSIRAPALLGHGGQLLCDMHCICLVCRSAHCSLGFNTDASSACSARGALVCWGGGPSGRSPPDGAPTPASQCLPRGWMTRVTSGELESWRRVVSGTPRNSCAGSALQQALSGKWESGQGNCEQGHRHVSNFAPGWAGQ